MATDGEEPITVDEMARLILKDAHSRLEFGRFVLGIAGLPGAGKSTLSYRLRDAINAAAASPIAQIAPMDGFHMLSSELEALGWQARKGEPDTFDVDGFVKRLAQVRAFYNEDVSWPTYDRVKHDPTPAGVVFSPSVKIVITEGNYLLLNGSSSWGEVRGLLDVAWYLDAQRNTIEQRLVDRQICSGKSEADAREKVVYSDLENARLIARSKWLADMILHERDGAYYLGDVSDDR